MESHQPPSSREEFDVAIICALPLEFDAAVSVLDEIWDDAGGPALGKSRSDLNTYVNGRIGAHNVVLVLLSQRMGKVSAAISASDLRHSYPNVRLALLVGICGGVPLPGGETEILLGDVAISSSLVQYDFGRRYPDGFQRKSGASDNLAGLGRELAGLINMLQNTELQRQVLRERTAASLRTLQQRDPARYAMPDPATDRLYRPDYRHKHQAPDAECLCHHHVHETDPVCEKAVESACHDLGCEDSYLVPRRRLDERIAAVANGIGADEGEGNFPAAIEPVIHIGRVASGDTVMKSGVTRDRIAATEKVIAFEMEGAGIWEHVPSLVVKGVCDYADSHKNKKWQHYAAGTAAAVAKAILSLVPVADRHDLGGAGFRKPEWMVPFPPDPDFLDRPDTTEWLKEKSKIPGTRVALIGLGGIGKSQLAIQFAHSVRNRSHVFWLSASTRATLEESFRAVAERLKLPSQGKQDSVLEQVGRWLSDERNGRWTVILDNLDDPSVLTEDDPRLLKALPQANHGFTIITARSVQGAELLTGGTKNTHVIEPMTEADSVRLFQTKLREPASIEDAERVVRLLGGVPLAIAQAASYINRRAPRTSAADYVRLFEEDDDRRGALLGSTEHKDLRRADGSSNSVLGTWSLTFEQVRRERPTAVDLLCFLSFFDPQSIPEWAVRPWYSPDPEHMPLVPVEGLSSLSSLMASLKGKHKVDLSNDPQKKLETWGFLLRGRTIQRGPMTPNPGKQSGKHSKSSRLSFFKKHKSSSSRSESIPGTPGHMTSADASDARSTTTLSSYDAEEEFDKDLEALFAYSLLIPTTRGALKMHPLVRHCTQAWLSQFDERDLWRPRFYLVMAQNLETPLAAGRSNMGLIPHLTPYLTDDPQDPLTARLWVHIASFVYSIAHNNHPFGRSNDDFKVKELKLADKIFTIADRALGPTDKITLITLDRLARALEACGYHERAFEAWEEVMARAEDSDSGGKWAAKESKLAYAKALADQGKLEDAERVTRELMLQREAELGDRAIDTLWSRANYADVLASMGRWDEAHAIAMEILKVNWSQAGDDQLHTQAISLCARVEIKMLEGRDPVEAEPLLREVVAVVEKWPENCLLGFPFNLFGHFHYMLSQCLAKQKKFSSEGTVLARGMEVMAKLINIPELNPPSLVDNLLTDVTDEEKEDEDNKALRRKLLDEVIGNLREDEEKPAEFYHGMANIARRLYIQHHVDEAVTLTYALLDHLKAHPAFGVDHRMTQRAVSFKEDMKWVEERFPKSRQKDWYRPDLLGL
jgi:nucleoside phosphorylase/tetratricopeptide (TPR) repeat protein